MGSVESSLWSGRLACLHFIICFPGHQSFWIPSPQCLINYCFPSGSHVASWLPRWLQLQCHMLQMHQVEPGSTFDRYLHNSHERMLLAHFKEMLFSSWWCGCAKAESTHVSCPSMSRPGHTRFIYLLFVRATTPQSVQDPGLGPNAIELSVISHQNILNKPSLAILFSLPPFFRTSPSTPDILCRRWKGVPGFPGPEGS